MANLEEQLILEEGLRLKPYVDTAGKITIGVGRNLTDNGITLQSAGMLLQHDIMAAMSIVEHYPFFSDLDRVRTKVIVDMAFQLGNRLNRFHNMLNAIQAKDYNKAADEMLNSDWAKQVPSRAARLAKMMRTGKDYDEA